MGYIGGVYNTRQSIDVIHVVTHVPKGRPPIERAAARSSSQRRFNDSRYAVTKAAVIQQSNVSGSVGSCCSDEVCLVAACTELKQHHDA